MKQNRTVFLVTAALFAALMCICGPLTVPIGPVPVTLANMVIFFSAVILGAKGSVVSCVVYLLLGLVGLPVFSGFQGGIGKFAGPTGGFLVGYILVALIGGLIMQLSKCNIPLTIVGLILGTAASYTLGTIWFVILMDCEIGYALSVCVFPFIIIDLIKIVIATIVGKQIRKTLIKANVLK